MNTIAITPATTTPDKEGISAANFSLPVVARVILPPNLSNKKVDFNDAYINVKIKAPNRPPKINDMLLIIITIKIATRKMGVMNL